MVSCCSSSRLRQLLKPLEFAPKTASDGAVLWCRARGRIGPGSQGLSSHPRGSCSASNSGGCLQPQGLFPWPHSSAGVGDQVSPSPHCISPGIVAAPHRLLFPLAEGEYLSSPASRVSCGAIAARGAASGLKLLSTSREDPALHPTKVMEKMALNRGFLCARLCCAG